MIQDDDKLEVAEPEEESGPETPPTEEGVGAEAPPTEEGVGAEAPPTEDEQPQPDYNSLEVVTTSPEDGRSGPGRGRQRHSYNSRSGGLAADDPFWTFGTPPETWGSSVRKPGGDGNGAQKPRRPRLFLECRSCGVKIEKKRAHGRGKVPCSMCGRWMQPSRQD